MPGMRPTVLRVTLALLVVATLCVPPARADRNRGRAVAARRVTATAVLAGGCFWGVEAVSQQLIGVRSVPSGYARDPRRAAMPSLPLPVEAVRIVYEPATITYRQLLDVFFAIAHDPTLRDRQGLDVGPEYRAVVFYQRPIEREEAERYIAELEQAKRFEGPVVTEVRSLAGFEVAEDDHQHYAARHPADPYIVQNDAPKLARLKTRFPALYQERSVP